MNAKGIIRVNNSKKHNFRNNILITTTCLLVLMLSIACPSTMARSRSDASKSLTCDQFMSLLRTQLNLTEDQETQIRPGIESDFKQREKIMADLGKDRESRDALKAELQNLQKSTEASVGPFLTDEQLEEFKTLYEQKLPKKPQRSGRTGRTGRSRS